MAVRDRLFISLRKELLGPRKGADEIMDEDPRNEYVTGILEPKDYDRGALEDYTKSDITAYQSEEEREEDRTDASDDYEINPVSTLDPRALPKSMGISFVIRSDTKPVIHICATWARYVNENNRWKRVPDMYFVRNFDASEDKKWDAARGVKLVARTIPLDGNKHHVSIFMINDTLIEGEKKILNTSHLIFQPEIRVKLVSGSLESLDDREVEGQEERKIELLYREFPALARGHLCGAIWHDIDPARPLNPDKVESSPLLSEDVKLLKPEDRKDFDLPDIRTDYLPSYSINQSTVGAEGVGLDREDVSADILSNRWDAGQLSESLEKLPNAYDSWISKQRERIKKSLPANHKKTAELNIKECEEVRDRIKAGIEILRKDDNARLAFCFMNRAMDTQSVWTRRKHLEWRPFQLGFILQCVRGITEETHDDRKICDLLWFPTGGGKTEAYLGLMIFTLAYRRRKNGKRGITGIGGAGTSVISRYTLRLLTIQQFRRTLSAITSCEFLRTKDWRPQGYKSDEENIWGTARFSIGLWVGGDVTPNYVVDHRGFDKVRKMRTRYVGAVGILMNTHRDHQPGERTEASGGEPAQVMKCPCCSSLLAIPSAGYSAPEYVIHWLFQSARKPTIVPSNLDFLSFRVSDAKVRSLPNTGYHVASIKFISSSPSIREETINEWWVRWVSTALGVKKPTCAYASRPGYFIRKVDDKYNTPCDFEIHCPNPDCELNSVEWFEMVPAQNGKSDFHKIIEPFTIPAKKGFSKGVPIPAYTVDGQVYANCPSVIIATADKFARLPFEGQSASIFGNVSKFDSDWGYYRDGIEPDTASAELGKPVNVEPFMPPELVIQDELHLIEGPLGSLAGLYECAVDALASRVVAGKPVRPKYIASTATVKQAASQVDSLFARQIAQFPPSGLSVRDNFFSTSSDGHPLDSDGPGRLYVGVCAPGKGPQTPTVRIWARLLQEAEEIRRATGGQVQGELDYYWTLVGYFNAIRELAAAASLYRQDIPERIKSITAPGSVRDLDITTSQELSSNVDSMKLPAVLEQIEKEGDNIDAVLATSMFGTGVDINRLSLMVVHGQPKSTASYIQATGRVGRQKGALVVTFLRPTRPRDLAHYEFFTGYHRALHRHVEPVTVAPFSPRACDRALGPVGVAILRNGLAIENTPINPEWGIEDHPSIKGARSGSRRMKSGRKSKELGAIADFLDDRAFNQPAGRKRPKNWVRKNLQSGFDVWENAALSEPSPLFYTEPSFTHEPEYPVVLGDASHARHRKRQVFENTPQSLREIESSTRFEG